MDADAHLEVPGNVRIHLAITNVEIANDCRNRVRCNDGFGIETCRGVRLDRLFYVGGDDAVFVHGHDPNGVSRDIPWTSSTAAGPCA